MEQGKPKPVFLFFVLVFVISIPFWILDAVHPAEMLAGLPISALGAFAPTIAALILDFREGGFPKTGELLRSSFDFNRIHNKIWLLVALLISPLIAVLAHRSMQGAGVSLPSPAPLTQDADHTLHPTFIDSQSLPLH